MIKAIIFDLDGVIIESAGIKTMAFRKLFEREYPDKVGAIVDYHINNMGVSRYVKFDYIYKNILGLPLMKDSLEELGRRFSAITLEEILKAPFVPGAYEFIETQYDRYLLFIASGTPEEELHYIAEIKGITMYFREIHGSPRTKTEIVSGILLRTGFNPREVVFVGDAKTDLRAAEDTGLHFVARVSNEFMGPAGSRRIEDLRGLELIIKAL